MKALIFFISGFITSSILCILVLIAIYLGPITIWPFSYFVTVKNPTASLHMTVRLQGGTDQEFWQNLAIFAEENGFDTNFPPYDYKAVGHIDASLRRSDGINVNARKMNGIYYLGVTSFTSPAPDLHELQSKLTRQLLKGGFSQDKPP